MTMRSSPASCRNDRVGQLPTSSRGDFVSSSNGILRAREVRTAVMTLSLAILVSVSTFLLLCSTGAPRPQQPSDHRLSSSSPLSVFPAEYGIRYLVFGSSAVLGSSSRTGSNKNADLTYPQRLSPLSQTVSTRGGAALPAACTQSIVGDAAVYDVILLEFINFDDSHAILARRLRDRFPAAVFVLVRLWNPSQMKYRSSSADGDSDRATAEDLDSWRRRNGDLPLHSHAFSLAVYGPNEPNTGWSMEGPSSDDAGRLRETAGNIGAAVYELPLPSDDVFSFPQTFQTVMTLFREDDYQSLSQAGHELVADSIRSIVGRFDILGNNRRDETGTWGSGDHCQLWYSDGVLANNNGANKGVAPELAASNRAARQSRRRMTEFGRSASGHKHALEFGTSGGSITVANPFDSERMLYLTYMTVTEDDDDYGDNSNKMYPRTRVLLNGKPSVLIDPVHNKENAHLTRTTAVGVLPPGETVVQIDPLERTRLRFRLVGASVLGEESARVPVEFDFEPEPAAPHRPFWRWWS